MRKKGDLSLNFIVLAALALIVLIIIALYFTGGLEKLFKEEKEVIELTTQEKMLAKSVCELHCAHGDRDSYQAPEFPENVIKKGYRTCEDLTDKPFDEYCTGKKCSGASECIGLSYDECSALEGCTWD